MLQRRLGPRRDPAWDREDCRRCERGADSADLGYAESLDYC